MGRLWRPVDPPRLGRREGISLSFDIVGALTDSASPPSTGIDEAAREEARPELTFLHFVERWAYHADGKTYKSEARQHRKCFRVIPVHPQPQGRALQALAGESGAGAYSGDRESGVGAAANA